MLAVERQGASDEIGPSDRPMIELEAPMRRLAGGDPARDLLARHCQRGTIVDPGLAALLRELALQVQLLRRLEAGIEPARRLQALGGGGVAVEAVGLTREVVPVEAEPAQIRLDRVGKFRPRALAVGVVETQQEVSAALAREEPVDEGRARIAE